MQQFDITKEILAYETSPEITNVDERVLVYGSQNVLIDYQKKVRTRPGFTRLGAGNASATPITNGPTWHTSTGQEFPTRHYDDEFEVYLGTIDGTIIDAWTRVASSLSTNIRRVAL